MPSSCGLTALAWCQQGTESVFLIVCQGRRDSNVLAGLLPNSRQAVFKRCGFHSDSTSPNPMG